MLILLKITTVFASLHEYVIWVQRPPLLIAFLMHS